MNFSFPPDIADRLRHLTVAALSDPADDMPVAEMLARRAIALGRRRRFQARAAMGAVLLAGAVATVVVFTSAPPWRLQRGSSPTPPLTVSARQILLAASYARAESGTPSGVFELRTETFGPLSSPRRAREDRKGPSVYGITTEVERVGRKSASTATTIVTGPDGHRRVTRYRSTRWRWVVGERSLTYAQLQKLPTNPRRLAQRLVGPTTGFRRSSELFDTIVDLLMAPTPPRVQAAAWRMLAAVPDLVALGHVRDPLRREGVGVRISFTVSIPTSPSQTLPAVLPPGSPGTPASETLILSPRGGRLLATEVRFGREPATWTALVSSN